MPKYIFREKEFIENYRHFEKTFKNIYPNYNVAYSYKTNYTPYICRLVKELGGYAEVVSPMEYELARNIGYDDDRIIFNGPCKHVFPPCMVNVDSIDELKRCDNPKIGIRVNIDVGQSFVSRFGIENVDEAFSMAGDRIKGIHCHISQARSLEAWEKRMKTMLSVADRYFKTAPEYIDLGSGMYGDMDDELKSQFSSVPSYEEYAEVTAGLMLAHYGKEGPMLFTEPGTTLVNRYMDFEAHVEGIKHIRGKTFVVMDGSKHNLGEICELKNVPITVEHAAGTGEKLTDAIITGYTCLEHDVMYRGFEGELAAGDKITFHNVGGYSNVMKPPFIAPNAEMVTESGKVIKRQETFEDIFRTYE